MAITTKAELESQLSNWLHRTDLTDQYEEWEQLAEEVFKGPIREPDEPQLSGIRVELNRVTGTLSTSNAYISRPTDFLSAQTLRLTADPMVFLEYVSNEFLNGARRSGTGKPRYYTVTDVIEFDVLPDSAYAYELAYFPDVGTTLVGANTSDTNDILTNHAGCYLALCLHFAFDYIQDTENAKKWLNRYRMYASNANRWFQESRFTQAALQSRPDVSTY